MNAKHVVHKTACTMCWQRIYERSEVQWDFRKKNTVSYVLAIFVSCP